MQVVFPGNKIELDISHGTGIALGNFDGLHLGHMELIKKLIRICKREKLTSIVYTFHNHPENVIASRVVTPLITTNDMKVKILEEYDLSCIYFEQFDERFMKKEAADFVKEVLVDKFNVKYIVVGYNYHFGHKGTGNPELLKELGSKYGFDVEVVMPVKIGDTIVSSSIIREMIQKGDMEQAHRFLGRSYSIAGKIVTGKRLGSKLGFPTINIIPGNDIVLPWKGVYITLTRICGQDYPSITNVGNNPTVGDKEVRIETYLLNFSGDLYGMETEVLFLQKMRDEKKFKNINELANQITKDVMTAEKFFMDQGIYNKMNIC